MKTNQKKANLQMMKIKSNFSNKRKLLTTVMLIITVLASNAQIDTLIEGSSNPNIKGTNTVLGDNAGHLGTYNTCVGYSVGALITGSYNTLTGAHAGSQITTGANSSFFGYRAGYFNTSGNQNTIIGSYSGYLTKTGSGNTFLGSSSGYQNNAGSYNTFLGYATGLNNTGNNNIFIGSKSGIQNEKGNNNLFIGVEAGRLNGDLNGNIAIGNQAGFQNLGEQNIIIGNAAGFNQTGSYKINIADFIMGDYLQDMLGINQANPAYTLDVGGNFHCSGSGYVNGNVLITSDKKFKANIQPINNALNKIQSLLGTEFEFKRDDYKNEYVFPEGKQYGFIAQDLNQILPEAVVKDAKNNLAVNYIAIIPILVEALKEQQLAFDNKTVSMQNEINSLKSIIAANNLLMPSQFTECEAQLSQNNPNPFNTISEINYYIPASTDNAAIQISDIKGNLYKTYTINQNGYGSLKISAIDFEPGTYFYSLISNGKEVTSRKMIVIK